MAVFYITALLLAAWPLGHALDWLFNRLAYEFSQAAEALRRRRDPSCKDSKNNGYRGVIIYNLSYTSRHER